MPGQIPGDDHLPDGDHGYQEYARFYDRLMVGLHEANGLDVNRFSVRVRDCIMRYMPHASSLLDLGCGTGTVLAGLPHLPSRTGLDVSPRMLAVARSKVPAALFIEGDMAAFSLGTRFDVVISVFDTVNYLDHFDRWISLFDCVQSHLADGGIFVFDVVTMQEFRRLNDSPPYVHDFDHNTMITNLELADDSMSATWDIRIFEHLTGNRYVLHRERYRKLAVPVDQIVAALAPHFELAEMVDQRGQPPGGASSRVYFVGIKRLLPSRRAGHWAGPPGIRHGTSCSSPGREDRRRSFPGVEVFPASSPGRPVRARDEQARQAAGTRAHGDTAASASLNR